MAKCVSKERHYGRRASCENELSPQKERVSGYGMKLSYDVPQTKFNGTLEVRGCSHSLVYLAEVDFGDNNLSL
jgi:hypothetical protein